MKLREGAVYGAETCRSGVGLYVYVRGVILLVLWIKYLIQSNCAQLIKLQNTCSVTGG